MIHNNPRDGFEITIADNGKNIHSMLTREGCDGSPACAMEMYISNSHDWLHNPSFNIHYSDDELELIYRAVKAIRKLRKKAPTSTNNQIEHS